MVLRLGERMGTKDRSKYFTAQLWRETPAGGFGQDGRTTKLLRTRTGVSQPNWRKKIEDHQNATTPLSGTFISVSARPSYCYNRKSTGIVSWRGDLAAYDQAVPSKPVIAGATAHQIAVSKALKQIRQAQIQMSGGVFLGELREAIHMLRHPAEALGKALKESYIDKLKRIKKRDPRRWQKAIAQTWLEGTFGWIPFVNDLYDAGLAYQEATQKEERFMPIRAVGKDHSFVNEFNGYTSYPPGENLQNWTARRTMDHAVCVIRGQVKAQANTTKLDKLRCFGLTPSEFVPTVWELLPWSFLVDYFSNVGDILENSVTDTSGLAWVSEDTIQERVLTASVVGDLKRTQAVQGPTFVSFDAGRPSEVEWKYRVVNRAVGADLSVPPLRFELPGKPTQHLNMVALFAQAYYGLHPQKSFRR